MQIAKFSMRNLFTIARFHKIKKNKKYSCEFNISRRKSVHAVSGNN